ncbi:15293_t:CDS:2 [Funneliformis caledonium]|uniref:non-specific serine/threonine protein kinase n=1 Tax=Funneliformis caledonium TaxID=1117310 RepID=A0A9N9CAP4_9GLOM|nr:15293_t:CDS:2 [Funneliformis caledonium]
MNHLGTTTKTIRTYGKKSNERVIAIHTWRHEINKELEGTIKDTENSLEKDRVRAYGKKSNERVIAIHTWRHEINKELEETTKDTEISLEKDRIRTNGKKSNERVIAIHTLNHKINKELEGTTNDTEISLAKDKISKFKNSTTQHSFITKGSESEPVKRKSFTKGFTKPKYYLSPTRQSPKPVNHANETSRVNEIDNISPSRLISKKNMIQEGTLSPNNSINKTQLSMSQKPFKKKYHSPSKDYDHYSESLGKVIIKDLNNFSEKENVDICHNDFEIDSNSQISKKLEHRFIKDHKAEIDKPAKEIEQDRNESQELTKLLRICDQEYLWAFEEFLGKDCLNNAMKIGEASFSEVFTAYAPKFTTTKTKCVFKIVPFGRGKEILVNGEEQCSVRDITQEIKTTLELGGRTGLDPKLRVGFLRLYGVGICRGKYPEVLLKEWDRWDKAYKSESARPDYFDDKQLYAVLIVEYGGLDLEHIKLKNWAQAWSVLTQVGWSIAQAEQSLNFEHRDLHWGNITIKQTKVKYVSYNLPSANINVEIKTFGVRACIIDYTLSRMERGNEIIHVDIVDEGYFTGKGDYQFDVYRMMREETKGDWKSFWPKTNVFWLHYIADKLLSAKKLTKPKKGNDQYDYYNAILGFKKRALVKNGGYQNMMETMSKDEAWQI